MFKLKFLFFTIIALQAIQASADSAKSGDLLNLQLDDLMNVEVTTVSKKATKISEAPASVVVITSEQIKRFGYRKLSDILRTVPGMYISNDRNYEYLGVRGFARPGDYSTRILLLIDSHRINDAIYDQTLIGEEFPLDVESIDRVEIAKGPGSAVWGSNALLAVVNVFTKRGAKLNGGKAIAEYGSLDRTKGFLTYGDKTESGFEYAFGVSGLTTDGEKDITFPEFNTPENNFGVAHNLDKEASNHSYLALSYQGIDFLAISGWRKKDIPTGAYGTAFNTPGTFTTDSSNRFEIKVERNVGTEWNGKILTRFYFDQYRYFGDYVGANTDSSLYAYRDIGRSKQLGGELRYTFTPYKSISFLTGIEAYQAFNLTQGDSYIRPEHSHIFKTNNDFAFSSVYGESSISLLGNLDLTLGARLDNYTTFGTEINPRAALVYSPLKSTAIKLLAGRAFRAPNEYERNYESLEFAQVGNSDLNPETIRTYELVIDHSLSTHTRLSLSVFDFRLDDIITQIERSDGNFQFVNLGAVNSRGLELYLSSKLTSGILFYSGLGYSHAIDTENDLRISNSPYLVSNTGISIPLIGEDLTLSSEFSYISSRRTLRGNSVSGTPIINTIVSSDRLWKDLNLSFGVYNLADKAASDPGANEHYQDSIPQVGRTFRIQLGYYF